MIFGDPVGNQQILGFSVYLPVGLHSAFDSKQQVVQSQSYKAVASSGNKTAMQTQMKVEET